MYPKTNIYMTKTIKVCVCSTVMWKTKTTKPQKNLPSKLVIPGGIKNNKSSKNSRNPSAYTARLDTAKLHIVFSE